MPASRLSEVFGAAKDSCPVHDASLVIGPALGGDGIDEPYVAMGLTEGDSPIDAIWLDRALGERGIPVWTVRGDNHQHTFDIRWEQASVAGCGTEEVEFIIWSLNATVDLAALVQFAGFQLDDPELDGARIPLTTPSPTLVAPEPVAPMRRQPLDVKEDVRFEVAVYVARTSDVVRDAVVSALNASLQSPSVDEEILDAVLGFSAKLNDGPWNLRLGRWATGRLDHGTPALHWLRRIAVQVESAPLLKRVEEIENRNSPLRKLELALNGGEPSEVRAVLYDQQMPPAGEVYDRALALLGISPPVDAEHMMRDFHDFKLWMGFTMATMIADPEAQLVSLEKITVDSTPGLALVVEAAAAFARRRLGDDVPNGLVDRLLAVPHPRTAYWVRQLTRTL